MRARFCCLLWLSSLASLPVAEVTASEPAGGPVLVAPEDTGAASPPAGRRQGDGLLRIAKQFEVELQDEFESSLASDAEPPLGDPTLPPTSSSPDLSLELQDQPTAEMLRNSPAPLYGEEMPGPSPYGTSAGEATESQQQPYLVDGPASLAPQPSPPYRAAIVDGGFANFVPRSGLRRLGPCDGSCELKWYSGRLWFEAEFLAWSVTGYDLPALMTTGSGGTPIADAGQLDQGDTEILIGDETYHDDMRSGGRITGGFWCTPQQFSGWQFSYFGIDGQDISRFAHWEEYPVIARPFTNATSGLPDAQIVAYPGVWEGTSLAQVEFELAGAEVLFRRALSWTPQARWDFLIGYRYGRLYDGVRIRDSSLSLDASSGFDADTIVERQDRFRLVNNFHGAEMGLSGRWWRGCYSLHMVGKVAYGGVSHRSGIFGDTTIIAPDATVTTYEGGVLALPTNIGSQTERNTAVLSELGISLEYQVGPRTRFGVGYTLFHWSDVARIGSLIDTNVNPSQIPPGALIGVPAPGHSIDTTDFMAHGIHASFEHQF